MLKNAATKLAHSSLPSLGNRELKPLQDLITAEKTVLVSLQKLSNDFNKSSDALKAWALTEEEELADILGASSELLRQFSTALYQYSSYQHAMREHMKAVRDREEALEELKRRRRSLFSKMEAADRKLASSTKSKNLAEQQELSVRLREQVRVLDEDIVREESALRDYKRTKARAWMEIKFAGLMECCQKGRVACDFGKLVINEISDQISQPGVPPLPYTKQDKVQSILQAGLQSGENVAFSSFSLDSNPSNSVARSRGDSVSSLYEPQVNPPPPTYIEDSSSHLRNDSTTSTSSASSSGDPADITSSSDIQSERTLPSLPEPPSSSVSVPTTAVFQQPDDAVVVETVGNNILSNQTPIVEEVPVIQTQPETAVSPPPLRARSSSLMEEGSGQASVVGGRGILAGGRGGRGGGNFAAFPVKKRVPTGTDRSVAQSAYASIQGIEPLAPKSLLIERRNSAEYSKPLDVLKEDEADEEQPASPMDSKTPTNSSVSPSIASFINAAFDDPEDNASTDPVQQPLSSSPKPQAENPSDEIDLDPSTPRPYLPSPRFSTHFTTKAYFELLSQRNQDPLPPLPSLPALPSPLPSAPEIDISTSTSVSSLGTEPANDAQETNEGISIGESEPPTPRAIAPARELSPSLLESSSAPVVEPEPAVEPVSVVESEPTVEAVDVAETEPTVDSKAEVDSESIAESPMESPATESENTLNLLLQELSADSKPLPKPEVIVADPVADSVATPTPAPVPPNRVRFASNPIEIRSKSPVDSLFTLDYEEDDRPFFVDGDHPLPKNPTILDAAEGREFVSSAPDPEPSQPNLPSDVATEPNGTNEELTENSVPERRPEPNIMELLNAATLKASSILASLNSSRSNTPSPISSRTPSPSPSSIPGPRSDLSSKNVYPLSSSTPPKANPAQSNTLNGYSTSPERTTAATPPAPQATPILPAPATAPTLIPASSVPSSLGGSKPPFGLGRNTSILRKMTLPSSPYPQRRAAGSPSLSSSGASQPTTASVSGPKPQSLSRSSSANVTAPSGSKGSVGSLENGSTSSQAPAIRRVLPPTV